MPSITHHRIYRVAWTPRHCVVTSTITAALIATWTPEHGWIDAGRLPDDIRAAANGVKPTAWRCQTCAHEGFSFPMPSACLACGSEHDDRHGPIAIPCD